MKNLYEILGVPPSATQEELHVAFKALAIKHHPDKQDGDPVLFPEITAAYAVLKDKTMRASYDKLLSIKLSRCEKCKGAGTTTKQRGFTLVERVQCKACGGAGYL